MDPVFAGMFWGEGWGGVGSSFCSLLGLVHEETQTRFSGNLCICIGCPAGTSSDRKRICGPSHQPQLMSFIRLSRKPAKDG